MPNKTKLSRLLCLFIIPIMIFCYCSRPKHTFEYAEAETEGFSSQKLDRLSTFLDESGSSALILMVDGKIVFEWGKTKVKHTIHSIRKSMINALYGIKIDEGIIDTSLTLENLNIDDIEPGLSENEKSARIADLLKSRSGVYHDAAAVSEGMLVNQPARDEHKPGEHFYYNNWDFNVLGSILEQKTGQNIYKLFKKEIAIPLGMNDYKGKYSSIDGESDDVEIPDTDGFYQYEKSKTKYPAYHFRMSARDMALFGQLYLNNGKWGEKQIIPVEWIASSTKAYSISNPEYGLGYGMLWNVVLEPNSTARNPFFHTGAGIHMLGIYPSSNLVLVHRVDTENEFSFDQSDLFTILDLVFDAQTE